MNPPGETWFPSAISQQAAPDNGYSYLADLSHDLNFDVGNVHTEVVNPVIPASENKKTVQDPWTDKETTFLLDVWNEDKANIEAVKNTHAISLAWTTLYDSKIKPRYKEKYNIEFRWSKEQVRAIIPLSGAGARSHATGKCNIIVQHSGCVNGIRCNIKHQIEPFLFIKMLPLLDIVAACFAANPHSLHCTELIKL